MKLKLVKQGDFLGTTCDFYRDENDNIYMSRTQIGYALEYKKPNDSIRTIHQRNHKRLDSMCVEVRPAQFVGVKNQTSHFRNNEKAFLYNEKGIYEICRCSRQKVANEVYDWTYDVVAEIKKNRYYIATEKDEQWLSVRGESKVTRRTFTDEVQEFVYYASQQGSKKPQMYYLHFTKLVNEKLGVPKGIERETLTQDSLMDIMALERVMAMKLRKLLATDDALPYKEVYKIIKNLIMEI